jgi:hypothetical protein
LEQAPLAGKLKSLLWRLGYTFVLFNSIKFELICFFDKHSVDFMISAPVAEHQLLVFLVGQPRTIFRPLRKKFSFPGFWLVKIPLEQVPLAGKLKSLLWRLGYGRVLVFNATFNYFS